MEELLSTAQVAKMLRISRVAVLKKIQKQQMKAKKIGRNYVVPKEEVLKSLGEVIGEENKQEIDRAVRKAARDFGDAFRKLGKE